MSKGGMPNIPMPPNVPTWFDEREREILEITAVASSTYMTSSAGPSLAPSQHAWRPNECEYCGGHSWVDQQCQGCGARR